jgi:hypothetical protein
MSEAIQRAEHWWQAKEVLRVFPDGQATSEFLGWLSRIDSVGREVIAKQMLPQAEE